MTRLIRVLIVEDNEADAALICETLEEQRSFSSFDVVGDGATAFDFLMRAAPYEDATRPDLILLDLNLPKLDGGDLLKLMRENGDLARIPVVMLTSSDSESDIARAYGLGANCYVLKPLGLKAFRSTVQVIDDFWTQVARLP